MKKITLLLAFIGMLSFQSCTVNDSQPIVQDSDTISEVYEYSVSFTAGNNYSELLSFPHTIYSSDMVLVYRLSGVTQGTDIWKLEPETYYFNDGTLDFGYDFDFTRYDVNLFMHGNNLGTVSSNFRLNQIFRVVIVPGYFGKNASKTVNFEDYNAVVKSFKIDESKLKK